ncbi:MAG: cohesin domain-containing protein [Acidobacteria bacterium]|jgi:hypothetical protein|nr:cohesin domain-containing protein [Acidobacteriota bacterium]
MRPPGRVLAVLALLLAASASASAAATARLPAARGATNTDVVVPIRLDSADGVTAMDFSLDYDASVAQATGVYRTTYTQSYSLSSSLSTPGRVSLSLSAGLPLTGSGEVAWIVFRLQAAAGQSGLSWFSCSINGGTLPCSTQNGTLTIATANAIVSVPDGAGGGPGTTLTVPISATNVNGVESADLWLFYNAGVLNATGVSKTTLTQSMTLSYNLSPPGEVRISLFTAGAPLSGSGDLAIVTFQVVGPLGDATPLNLTRGQFNEGTPSTLLDDGLFRVCDAADGDNDGLSACAGDCNNANAQVRPGLPEVCDGLDNDCDGFTDNAPLPGNSAALAGTRVGAAARLAWPAFARATGYDTVRGSLATLRATGGFAGATLACLADDAPATTLDDAPLPTAADGFWYAVRGVNCGGAGSYDDSAGTGQAGPRDPGISASPHACP